MKKTLKSLVEGAIWALMACMAYSCVEKIEQPVAGDQESGLKTCSMIFEGEVIGFSQDGAKPATKAAKSAWEDGDRIYITFYKQDSTKVAGSASYSSARGWSVTYDGTLDKGSDLTCEVRYFVNAPYSNQNYLDLDSGTEIYETMSGTYDYDGSSLTVEASMTPKTGRIRFSGNPGDEIYLYGIATYLKYTGPENAYTFTWRPVKTQVDSSGYTPYIYAFFYNNEARNLAIIGSDSAYTKSCSEDVLKVGESGYMTIPSENYYNNWQSNLKITYNGVEFSMVAVPGHSDGFFLIGETEVTNELYTAVVYGTATTTDPQYPMANVTYENFSSFVTKLSNRTGFEFKIPSLSQWQYASGGGRNSQGYTYSGSDAVDHVAWHSGNSNNELHPVKQKAPNELGVYDMSGNVWEFTSTTRNSWIYSHFYCGGSYFFNYTYCTSQSSGYNNQDHPYGAKDIGLRLLLAIEE